MVHVDRWICSTLELGVSELHLGIRSWCHQTWQHLFPLKVFTSTTLVTLSLGTRRSIDGFPSDTYLPSLKTLFLDRIWFKKSEEFSNVFLPACPVLEELTLNHESFLGKRYVISSKTIKRLSVTNTCPSYRHRSITLDMPSVVELYFSDYVGIKYLNCNLDSLEKATLDLHIWGQFKPDVTVTHLINEIRNVKTLHLTSSAIEVILTCYKNGLPVFKNLVKLTFSSNKERGWKVFLPHLLKHSPNLETLLSGLDSLCGSVMISIPTNNQVKTLHIMEFKGSSKEMIHIRCLLPKMGSLEVVRVCYDASQAIAMNDDPEKVKQLTDDTLKLHKVVSSKLKLQVIM